MFSTHRKAPGLFIALIVGAAFFTTVVVRAQLPPASLQQQLKRNETPSLPDKAAYTPDQAERAHWRLLTSLYPEAALKPLHETGTPGLSANFTTALVNARAARVPEGILVEAEAMRAMTDGNFPAFAATAGRLQTAEALWQEKNSLFASQEMAAYFVNVVNTAVTLERSRPGTFARTAAVANKRELARREVSDLRIIEGSIDLYALQHNCRADQVFTMDQWLALVPADSHLRVSSGLDLLGHPYGPQVAGKFPSVPPETYVALRDVVPDTFWGRYNFPGKAPE